MSADYIPAPIRGEFTHRLADMSGVLADLRWAAGVCAKLLKRHEDVRQLNQDAEAFEVAAIIRYCRAFKGGVRNSFSLERECLPKVSAQLRSVHEVVEALRDKHIAHSVNDWELNQPVAYLRKDNSTGERAISSISCQQHRIVGLSEDHIEQFHQLATELGELVESEIDSERQRVLEHVRATMTLDQVEAATRAEQPRPGYGELAERRKR